MTNQIHDSVGAVYSSREKEETERARERVRQRQRQRENSNLKTLFYKDCNDCNLGSVKNLSNN